MPANDRTSPKRKGAIPENGALLELGYRRIPATRPSLFIQCREYRAPAPRIARLAAQPRYS